MKNVWARSASYLIAMGLSASLAWSVATQSQKQQDTGIQEPAPQTKAPP